MLWRIGLVGFDYPEWAGTFYPRPLAHKDRLAYYATQFDAVEINTTFYAVPTGKTVRHWADAARTAADRAAASSVRADSAASFLLCPKLIRDITHGPTPPGALAAAEPPPGHLNRPDTAATLRRWLDAVRGLGPHLGPILIQFPPRFAAARAQELHDFLSTLPRDLRYAVEVRHRSWFTPDTAAMLAQHHIAWVCMDQTTSDQVALAPREPPAQHLDDPGAGHPVVATSDFLYVRFLGRIGQFANRTREHLDPTPRLAWWADRLRAAASRHPHLATIHVFFDNNLTGFAPATARRFGRLAGLGSPDAPSDQPARPAAQGELFA
jgi:uncharacterized protein YecE (DUF72 family)